MKNILDYLKKMMSKVWEELNKSRKDDWDDEDHTYIWPVSGDNKDD